MADKQAIFQRLATNYERARTTASYLALYRTQPAPLDAVFALLHERLDYLLQFMNTKNDRGGHYNADASRELIDLISEIRGVRATLSRVGIEARLREDYERTLEQCSTFLVKSGGSPIPETLGQIAIDRDDPIFLTDDWTPPSASLEPPKKTMVGEGAFAIVYRYTEPTYGFSIASKVAKRGLDERELIRFRAEYDVLKSVSFPYVVEAFHFDESGPAFTMEYCESNLDDYISKHNSSLPFATRRRIALQFLYGENYLHAKQILHRDISRRNVLLKTFDMSAVVVKLSDFGLHKPAGSDFTRTESDMKGTILDPTLANFKDFAAINDIYAVGHIIAFIFTGKKSITDCPPAIQAIVNKCVDHDTSKRYNKVAHIVADLELATEGEPPVPAGAPA